MRQGILLGMSKDDQACPKCGCSMEQGSLRVRSDPSWPDTYVGQKVRMAFVVPGTPTSLNPIKAFAQGLNRELEDKLYPLPEIHGLRCQKCGFLEFYAAPPSLPLDD